MITESDNMIKGILPDVWTIRIDRDAKGNAKMLYGEVIDLSYLPKKVRENTIANTVAVMKATKSDFKIRRKGNVIYITYKVSESMASVADRIVSEFLFTSHVSEITFGRMLLVLFEALAKKEGAELHTVGGKRL